MIDPDDGFMSDKLPEISFEAQHRLELSQVSNTVRFGENVRPILMFQKLSLPPVISGLRTSMGVYDVPRFNNQLSDSL